MESVPKMRPMIELQQQLVPDLMEVMKKRYFILRHVMLSDSVGRRTLAGALGMTERVLRAETDYLKAQGLLDIHVSGMRISEQGRKLVSEMEPLFQELFG